MSLLQPGPETFSLFDEVILLAEGRLVYAGPVEEVVEYFAALGYRPPDTMDVADFLQSVATPDGAAMLVAGEEGPGGDGQHRSAASFAEAFRASDAYRRILAEQASPPAGDWAGRAAGATGADEENPGGGEGGAAVPKEFAGSYCANSFWTSAGLLVRRNLTLLKRDTDFLIGKAVENLGMGIGMALIFLQAARFPSDLTGTDMVADYFEDGCSHEMTEKDGTGACVSHRRRSRAFSPVPLGVPPAHAVLVAPIPHRAAYMKLLAGTYSSIFLTTIHILLGTLTGAPEEVDARAIYYKHADAGFFQASAFLVGKQISLLPLVCRTAVVV